MAGIPVAGYGRRTSAISGGANDPIKLLLKLISGESEGRDEARQANESRYMDILELIGNTRGRVMGDLEGMGESLRSDADKSYKDLRNNLITDLADRGLSGSTKRIGVEAMTKRENSAEMRRIEDLLRGNRASADGRFTDKAAGVMERREDPYPKSGADIAALVSQLTGLIGGNLFGGGRSQGKGTSQSRRPYSPEQLAASLQAPAAVNPRAAADAQQREQDAFANRRAMGGLATAMQTSGMEGADREKQALNLLQSMGLAQHNPNAGVPQIGFAPTTQSVYETSGVPQYGAPQYDSTNQQQPSIDSIRAQRQARILSLRAVQNARAEALKQQAIQGVQAMRRRQTQDMFGG